MLFIAFMLSFLPGVLTAETLNGVEVKQGEWKRQQIEYLDGEILIGLKPDKTQSMFEVQLAAYPVEVVRNADRFGFMKLRVDEGYNLFEVIDMIKELPSVEYAEPNMVDRLLLTPDDPLYSTQWHYNNIGQVPPGGTVDADIDAPEGWEISTGSDTIIVGVLDSGIPMQGGVLSHPDLDDPNRFILGKDIVNNDFEPMDDNGHGTHVSGTIGAESNNGVGVAGVAWNVKVMAIKVFNSSGSGSHEYFRDGCIYGVDNGCKVLNYSGGGSAGETKEHGVAYADSNNVVLCAAAGNNWQGSVDWPGAYSAQYDNVICVSATDHNDNSSPFSSIGSQVTVAAPGGYGSPYDEDDIQSTFPNYSCYLTTNYGLPQNYSPLAGTSMATPHVAGFAALILSMNPGLTPDSVKQIMINSADDLGPAGFDNQFGWGRINVYNALSSMGSIIITHTPLGNTNDDINDYEVLAKIWSITDLVPDSLLLYYELNSTWYEEVMTATGLEDEYHAYIPAQTPGTTINYYLFAQNIDGDADTTDTYTFSVLDYGVSLTPTEWVESAPAYDTVWYDFQLANVGAYTDQYDLALSGNVWQSDIMDVTKTTVISTTPVMAADDVFDLYVRVVVPSTLEGEFDSLDLVATSQTNAGVNVTAFVKTISTGQPWEIPFTDLFVTTSFDITKWESTDGATINSVGLAEPSEPYSVDLNGDPDGNDVLITEMINLKDQTNVILKYYYEQTGGGESPDADDDLIISYLNVESNWVELNRHLGSGPDMTEYEEVELNLPTEAMHAGFRLKIECTATSGAYDDWFVDDLYIGHPSDYEVRMFPSLQSQYGPAGGEAVYNVSIWNKGFLDDNFDLSYVGTWDVNFYDETGINAITSTGIVPGGDTVDIVVKVSVPPGTPLHDVSVATITATSQGDNNMTAYGQLETISAGFAAAIPWYETFPTSTLEIQKWFTYDGAQVTSEALNEPSPDYSINLDGGKDTLTSQLIDLDGLSGVLLSYFYERGGNSDAPEAGDNLWVEYRNSTGNWVELNYHSGAGEVMTEFEYVSLLLPPDAMHNSAQIRFRTYGEEADADDWFVDNIRIDYAPDMNTTPASFSQTLQQGESSSGELIIANSGAGGLVYTIKIQPHLNLAKFAKAVPTIYPAEVYVEDLPKGQDIEYLSMEAPSSFGGPDDFGYYWLDSDEPGGPNYQWVDVSSTGVEVTSLLDDDNYIGPYDLGFDFPFYGQTYNQIYIGSNGVVGFATNGLDSRIGRPLPTATVPNAIIAWLWDDLDVTDADNPNVHVYFDSDASRAVIQFDNYPEYRADAGDVITAEVILRPDGSIKLQYDDIADGFDTQSCAVGIEDQNGLDGLQVVYHADYLKDKLAIEIFKPFDWLVLDQMEGDIPADGADTIDCQFITTEDLEAGYYSSDIVIHSNDPDDEFYYLGAELTVTEEQPYICGDASGDGMVNVSDAVYIINFVFSGGNPPDPLEAGEVNCDGMVNVSDAVFIINYVFSSGKAPCDSDGDTIPDC